MIPHPHKKSSLILILAAGCLFQQAAIAVDASEAAIHLLNPSPLEFTGTFPVSSKTDEGWGSTTLPGGSVSTLPLLKKSGSAVDEAIGPATTGLPGNRFLRFEQARDGSLALRRGEGANAPALFSRLNALFTIGTEPTVGEGDTGQFRLTDFDLETAARDDRDDWLVWRETRSSTFEGKTLTFIATHSIHRDLPETRHELEIRNKGENSIWVSGRRDAFIATYAGDHAPLEVYSRGWTGERTGMRVAPIGDFNVETLQYADRGWAALVYPDAHTLLLSTLREHPREHLVADNTHRWAQWHFGPRDMRLGLLDYAQGQVPVRVEPGKSARFGFATALAGPQRHPYPAGREFFHHRATDPSGLAVWDGGFSLPRWQDATKFESAPVRTLRLNGDTLRQLPHTVASNSTIFTLPLMPEGGEHSDPAIQFATGASGEVHTAQIEIRLAANNRLLRVVELQGDGKGNFTESYPLSTLHVRQLLYLRLIVKHDAAADPAEWSFQITPQPLSAPRLHAPISDVTLRASAVYYSWEGDPSAANYELWVAQNPEFTDAVTTTVANTFARVRHMPRELPGKGTLYWKVRTLGADGPGEWSAVERFQVEAFHRVRAPEKAIDATRPLFIFEAWKAENPVRFLQNIPDDLSDSIAVVFSGNDRNRKESLAEWLTPALETGRLVLIRPQGPWPLEQHESLAEIELLFQKYDNLLGVQFGERFWGWGWRWHASEYTERLIRLSAHYGKRVFWGDSNPNRWNWQLLLDDPHWRELLRTHAANLCLMPKNNLLEAYHVAEASVLGLWLSGYAANLGIWAEAWYWHDAGFSTHGSTPQPHEGNVDQMPGNFWINMWLLGAARGATVFCLDGQVSSTTPVAPIARPAIWTHEGEPTPLLETVILPFIRVLTSEPIIPDRETVLASLPFVVEAEVPPAPAGAPAYGNAGLYGERYGNLFSTWWGLERQADGEPLPSDLIPNRSSPPAPALVPKNASIDIETKSVDEAIAWIEAQPEREPGFTAGLGDRFFLQHNEENRIDGTQRLRVELDGLHIETVLPPHGLLFGHRDSDRDRVTAWVLNPSEQDMTVTFHTEGTDLREEGAPTGDSPAAHLHLTLPPGDSLQPITLSLVPLNQNK